ncbi:acyl carrier protein [Streptomyces sp. I05A-00742]|uniref:acyl carrier protein n=1 Tax=Streptomyces sp. I05A-00742 TaxID=2732853 RepID=UPI00148A0E18|nr:acyl carrier protein [Streptomyces sp. I05A-00742]
MSTDPRDVEPVIRDTVGAVLSTSAADWPRDRPLDELPDAIYDSLAQLEVLTRVERAFRLAPRPVEPDRLRTIGTIVALVTGSPSARTPADARPAEGGGV